MQFLLHFTVVSQPICTKFRTKRVLLHPIYNEESDFWDVQKQVTTYCQKNEKSITFSPRRHVLARCDEMMAKVFRKFFLCDYIQGFIAYIPTQYRTGHCATAQGPSRRLVWGPPKSQGAPCLHAEKEAWHKSSCFCINQIFQKMSARFARNCMWCTTQTCSE